MSGSDPMMPAGGGHTGGRGAPRGFGGWGLMVPFGEEAITDPETEKRVLQHKVHVLRAEIEWMEARIKEIETA